MAIGRKFKGDSETLVGHGRHGSKREVKDIDLRGPYGPKVEESIIFATIRDTEDKETKLQLSIDSAIALRNSLNDLIASREREATLARALGKHKEREIDG